MAPMDSPSSATHRGHVDYYSSPRRNRRTYTDSSSFAIDPNGHREKLPRPNPSLLEIYELEAEDAPATPKKAVSSESVVGMDKSAPHQYLWPTAECVFLRHATVSSPIPFGVVCTPFADSADSTSLPLSNLGLEEAIRCFRCRSYINPFWKKVYKEPTRMSCNMCGHTMDLPKTFLADMERAGQCSDMDNHPELSYGSVDFTQPKKAGELPRQFATAFVVDTSARAVSTGFTIAALQGIIDALLETGSTVMRRRVCLVTFDDVVTFYPRTRSGRFRAVTMRDVDAPFLPVSPSALMVDVDDPLERQSLLSLLETLQQEPSAGQQPLPPGAEPQVAGGAALRASLEAIAGSGGGDVVMLHGSCPNSGVGALEANAKKGLQQAAFYEGMLEVCRKSTVAVSCVTSGADLDTATLQWLSWRTGGDVLHFPAFNAACQTQLSGTLHHFLLQMQGSAYGCMFKLRCSKNLACKSMIAPWPAAASSTDQSHFELPRLTPDSCASFVLEPDNEPENDEDMNWGRRDTRRQLFVQAAVLYSNTHGERLLRVHTMVAGVASTIKGVCQSVSITPLIVLMLKQAVMAWLDPKSGSKVLPRDGLLTFCLQVLAIYRRSSHISESGRPALILSKRLCLLPLYVLAARKLLYYITDSPDNRGCEEEQLRRLLRMPVHSIMAALYPRVYPLPAATEDGDLPQPCITLVDQVVQGGSPAYLITNGLGAWYYEAEAATSPQSTDSPSSSIDLRQNALELSQMLQQVLTPSPVWMPLRDLPKLRGLSAESLPWQEQVLLSTLFIEDEGVTDMGYAEWIQFLHAHVLRMSE